MVKRIKVPDGYASNILRCVNIRKHKMIGLKSYDNHVLMQQLLSLAIQKVLSKNIGSVIIKLYTFFREICCKVVRMVDIQQLKDQIALILCNVERFFYLSLIL